MPQGNTSDLVQAGQVRVVFRQMPAAVAVNAVNGILAGTVLEATRTDWLRLAWLGLLLAVAASRAVLWYHYRRAEDQDAAARKWALAAMIGSGLTGAMWGCGAGVLFPSGTFEQMFLLFVTGGMCIGSVGVSSAHLPTFFAFLMTASLPIAVRFLFEAATPFPAMAGMIVVFDAALAFVALDFNRSIIGNLRLGLDLAVRTGELDAASACLV